MFYFYVAVDKLQELVYCFLLRYVLLDAYLLFVEANLATTGTDIAVVSICHLARTIDDTAHDTNLQTYQMTGSRLDFGDGLL